MDFEILGNPPRKLITEVKRGFLEEEEFSDLVLTQERIHARRSRISELSPVDSLRAFSETRPSSSEIDRIDAELDDGKDTIDVINRPETKPNIDEKFYNRSLREVEEGLLVDDNIWYDFFEPKERVYESTVSPQNWGFMKNQYSEYSDFDPKVDCNGEIEVSRSFNVDSALELLEKANENDLTLAYAEGLQDRLENYWDQGVVENFMDIINEMANAREALPNSDSRYPVDAGIADAAEYENLDILTYDRDFLDKEDPIWKKGVEIYTPQQACEMI